MKVCLAGLLYLLLVPLACAAEPRARTFTTNEIQAGSFTLRNQRLAATLMAPDRPSSVYCGQRFESGGVVLQVAVDGKHTFLGKEPRGGRLGGFGLIEEMGISRAVGYEEARPGEPFLKLGVGLLQRGKNPRYLFYPPHPEVERFPWQVSLTERSATFVQIGKPFKGTACRYEKRIVVDPKEPRLRIEHVLVNTGAKPIATDQYCHNFLAFDGAPPGPDYAVTTGFPLAPERDAPAMRIAGKTIRFGEILKGAAYCRFKGQPPDARSHSFRVRHDANGLEMAIGGDFPVSCFAYYADTVAISPEAYVAIHAKPGETFRWTRTYVFKSTK